MPFRFEEAVDEGNASIRKRGAIAPAKDNYAWVTEACIHGCGSGVEF